MQLPIGARWHARQVVSTGGAAIVVGLSCTSSNQVSCATYPEGGLAIVIVDEIAEAAIAVSAFNNSGGSVMLGSIQHFQHAACPQHNPSARAY